MREKGEAAMKDESIVFESLTPVDNYDLGIYEKALDYVFQNEKIKNVAITGAFGVGKSSMLESYEIKNRGRKFIHISLAHFKNQNEEKITETVLEGKILNQLIHQIPQENIPQTGFRTKSSASENKIVEYATFFSLLLLLLFYLITFLSGKAFVASMEDGGFKNFLSVVFDPHAYFLGAIVEFGLVFCLIYQIVKLQNDRRIFKKFSLKGNEIELFQNDKDSYFDKYLNEVLYLFENTDADVIVFEDMDRFDASSIFERLREVNTLVNLQLDGRILRFFYLLRDDIFSSKDRTKFFDFIIPIVPVVDGSNSYDQFVSLLQKNELQGKFDEHFLKGLSLYVDEMRLLKNICNEFIIYNNRLNTTELDHNKMLALITYKNLFPKDFSELQLGRGFVHALFENKEKFILSEINKQEKIISDKEEEIRKIDREFLNSSQEISVVYKQKIAELPHSYNRQTEIKKLEAEEKQRIKQYEDKENGRILTLREEIEQIRGNEKRLRSKSLHEIINRDNIDSVFCIEGKKEIEIKDDCLDVKANPYFPILKYLIRNGYIDESYPDYMTYFYGNGLSQRDKIFLRSITDRKAKEYQYELTEPQKVLEQLNEFDFDQEEVLNYSLIDYLLQTNSKSQYISHLIHQLQKEKKYDFISGYLNCSRMPVEFVQQCNIKGKAFFKDLISSNALSEEILSRYATLTLYSGDDKSIEMCNTENCLTAYICESASFMNIGNPRIELLIHGFSLINVLLKQLDYGNSNGKLFKAVYEGNFYEINFGNLSEILKNIHDIKDEGSIRNGNYTILVSVSDAPVKKYVEENMDAYLDAMLEFCEGRITDTNEAAAAILNNPNVSEEQKTQYISYLEEPFKEFSLVENKELWPKLIENDSIVFSEENVIDYYRYSKERDSWLIQFINQADRPIDFNETASAGDKEEIRQLFATLVACNELQDEKYTQCISTMKRHYNAFSVSGISVQKVKILIKHGVIQMNAKSLAFIRQNYKEAIPDYIYKYANEYVELIDDQLFDYSEMLQLLSMNIHYRIQKKLLEKTNEPVSVIEKGYCDSTIKHILINNLDHSDLSYLFEEYESYSPQIQSIIRNISTENPEEFLEHASKCSTKLIDNFLIDVNTARENKMCLLVKLIEILPKDQLIKDFNMLGLEEYVKIFDSHTRPKFEITNENVHLLEALVQKGLIYEYRLDESGEWYQIHRNKPRK